MNPFVARCSSCAASSRWARPGWAALVAVTLSASPGCHGEARPSAATAPPPDDGGRVEVTVVVENRLAWPWNVTGLHAQLGDAGLHLGAVASGATSTQTIAVRPRNHELNVQLDVWAPSGSTTGACVVRLAVTQGVHIGWNPAEIRLVPFSQGPTTAFQDQPDFKVALSGATEVTLPVQEGGFDERHCRSLEPIAQAKCRARAAVADAERERDVVRALCYRDLRDRIDKAAQASEQTAPAPAPAPVSSSEQPTPPPASDSGQKQAAFGEVARLSALLDQCLATKPYYVGENKTSMRRRDASTECAEAVRVEAPPP